MPSRKHEMPVELVRNCPRLAPELVARVFKLDLPVYATVTAGSETFSDIDVKTVLADSTIVLREPEDPARPGTPGRPVFAIIVESQLVFKVDKQYTWPVYASVARSRLKCPVLVLVLCPDDVEAAKCGQPIELGPGHTMLPLVIGPRDMPLVVDGDTTAHLPELVYVTAPAHADGPHRDAVLRAVLAATDTIYQQQTNLARLYLDDVAARLSKAALHRLEELMAVETYEYKSDFLRRAFGEGKAEGEARGKAEGEANAVLRVLEARGLSVPDAARQRIATCTDLELLNEWLWRAATASSTEELFTE